jgi:hypothetical protein
LFTFLWIILSSCINKPVGEEPITIPAYLIDRSWLTDEPCRAPCWYGLEPEKSTKGEAIFTVKELPFVNPESMIVTELYTSYWWRGSERRGIPSQDISFEYKDYPKVICVVMLVEKDISERLAWFILFPLFNISFGEVVDQIGPPDFIHYSRSNAEVKGCYVDLLWIERQMELTHIEERRGRLEKDLCDRIEEANNRVPSELTVFQVVYLRRSEVEYKTSLKWYFPWNGFISASP